MSDFTLPTNIKQIGSIGDGLRIYVEDYVCTFLHQYAETGGYSERLAFLVGRHLLIDGTPIVFINGAIHGKHTEESEGFLRFSEKSIEYAQQMLEEHFTGMELIGWMQSQPGYGTFLNQHYASYHLRQFRKPYQVMFVTDPLERSNTFFAPNVNAMVPTERMAALTGYFIYYDKNTNMHEYMLANKAMDYTAKSPTFLEIEPNKYTEDEFESPLSTPLIDESDEEAELPLLGTRDTRFNAEAEAEEILRRPSNYTNQRMRKRSAALPRRPLQLMGSLAAVLLVIVFVMGFELMRNQDRIERMETEIHYLSIGYRNLLTQAHTAALTPVFAEGDFAETPPPETQATPAPSPHPEGVQTGEIGGPAASPTPPPMPTPPPQEPAAEEPPAETLPAGLIPDNRSFPEEPINYVVQFGDSLIGISIAFFGHAGRVDDIIALNGITNPDHIVAGATLQIPRS